MPQVFRIGPYIIFFWSNEGVPLEPVHVHVAYGIPVANATKIWLTRSGHCLLCNNESNIPDRVLRNIMDILEPRSQDIVKMWKDYFQDVHFYC